MIGKCPRCGKLTENQENSYRPFCSERCKLVDLGNWVSGAYRISAKDTAEAEDDNGISVPRKDSDKG